MLDLTPIRAISLDLDDTLWPIWPTIERAERVLHTWLSQHAPAAAELSRNPAVIRAIREQVQIDWPERRHDLAALRTEAIRRLLRQAEADPELAEPAFEVFHAERQRVELFEDTMPLLRALHRHYPLLAITNGTAQVHQVGLGAWFSHAVNAPQLGIAKPDPGIFHHAVSLVGLAPEQVLHIGDDAHLDAWAARNAGLPCIWLNRQAKVWDQAGDPPPTVSSLDEIRLWIEAS